MQETRHAGRQLLVAALALAGGLPGPAAATPVAPEFSGSIATSTFRGIAPGESFTFSLGYDVIPILAAYPDAQLFDVFDVLANGAGGSVASIALVPEPSPLLLTSLGLAALAGKRRRGSLASAVRAQKMLRP